MNPDGQIRCSAAPTAGRNFIGRKRQKSESGSASAKTAARPLPQRETMQNTAAMNAGRRQTGKCRRSAIRQRKRRALCRYCRRPNLLKRRNRKQHNDMGSGLMYVDPLLFLRWFLLLLSPLVWYDCDTERMHFCYYKYFQKKRDTKREDIWYYDAINQPYF